MRAALREGNRAALIALLFPAVGVGLLVWAVRATIRRRRYGTSVLELGTLPAVVGHALEGTLRTPAGLRPPEGFRVVLSCIRRVTSGSGRNRSTSERILWQEERRATASGVGVPVAFAIPTDATPSDPGRSDDRTLWRLEVSAEVPGVDYAAGFEVPVFRTAESALPRTETEQAVAARSAVPADYRQPAGSRILVSRTRRGTEIYFPPARNPGMAASLTVFTLIWAAAIWATIAFDAPLIFPIVFGGIRRAAAVPGDRPVDWRGPGDGWPRRGDDREGLAGGGARANAACGRRGGGDDQDRQPGRAARRTTM